MTDPVRNSNQPPSGDSSDEGDLRRRCRGIRMLILDVDGVLTDGSISYDGEGRETKTFNVHDGSGLIHLKQAGLLSGVISGRDCEGARKRMADMKIDHFVLGRHRKLGAYEEMRDREGLTDAEIAYVGDDLLDLCLLTRVGLAITVPEGRPEVKEVCHHVTSASAGRGAVREVVEMILKTQGKWEPLLERYRT